jgi:hypothetical protein
MAALLRTTARLVSPAYKPLVDNQSFTQRRDADLGFSAKADRAS